MIALLWLRLKIWWKVLTSPRRESLLFLFYLSDKMVEEMRREVQKEQRMLGVMAGPYGSDQLFLYTLQQLSYFERQEARFRKTRDRACREIGFVPTTKTDEELVQWLIDEKREQKTA